MAASLVVCIKHVNAEEDCANYSRIDEARQLVLKVSLVWECFTRIPW